MSKNNSGLTAVLKMIRIFSLVNVPVRAFIKVQTGFYQKVFRFFSIHWPVSGIITFKLPEGEKVKIYSKGDDYVSTQAFWKGYKGYEGPTIQLFYYLAKKSKVILDIGTHVGYFTLIGAHSNPSASVFSFEPVKHIFNRLKDNIRINGLTNVTATESVVGNSEAPVKFYIPEGKLPFAGSTQKGWASGAKEVTIPSVSINTFKMNNKILKIDLIKIDCEFHEMEVLKGMSRVLKEDKPAIIMEVLFPQGEGQKGHYEVETYKEIETFMKENNYYFYLINEMALIRLEKLEYNPDERNYLFSTKLSSRTYLAFSDINSLVNDVL